MEKSWPDRVGGHHGPEDTTDLPAPSEVRPHTRMTSLEKASPVAAA